MEVLMGKSSINGLFSMAMFNNQRVYIYIYVYLVGGFNPSEKYESQLGLLFPIYEKIKYI